ncbi:MAG: methyltransferase domain-containing protein [Phaeodactylibacter sp.]|uniref:methyltransferase domain-containing protein n=1 Tax=Phaeodactylibacter sp. TaxID=1940289 RepID=UPI0032EBF3FB
MPALNEKIAHFYDRSTQVWLDTWGEHMHHGYYGDGQQPKDHRQAQTDLVNELLNWGGVTHAPRILDAGCGVGGSSRYLARQLGAEAVLGCTLSPVQAQRGTEYNRQAGLDQIVRTEARDMMSLRTTDGPFDLVWSMESAEHIEDKAGMLQLFYDLLAPGGRLLVATWCHRETPPALTQTDKQILGRIRQLYHLPPLVSLPELKQLAEAAEFVNVSTDDWSEQVAPFWKAVIQSALQLKSLRGLLQAGLPTIRGAIAMRHMTRGFKTGTIRFGLLQAEKPL